MSPQPQEDQLPAIRIVPHIEGPRSLHFDIIEREVPEGVAIKIGRFTDKAHIANRVTFKSKVVSRGHAEIWCDGGKFLIKDTKSSSGTFLNHNRLSAPGVESRPHQLKDGDVVQLGVDYQGGTEEIYRCVKMRIELNRSWQRQVNPFSINALKQLKQLTSPDTLKHHTTDCCICLSGIGPCQALFLAPCSHVFHYKCIRPLLSNHHSSFLCPLCRSFADLEAPIDNQVDWEQLLAEQEAEEKQKNSESVNGNSTSEQGTQEQIPPTTSNNTETLNTNKSLPPPPPSSSHTTDEEINGLGQSTSTLATSAPTSSAVPIPSRNRKTSNSSDEGDDPNLMLSRTLPSSPPPVFFDENGSSSPTNQHLSLRDQAGSPRLDEIAEEDEGTTCSSSTNPSGQNQNNGINGTSSLHESNSSASASDNDEELLPIGLLINESENPRVKGKGVARFEIDENGRENIS